MNAKQKKREYLIKRGFLKGKETHLKKTENNATFEYPTAIHMPFVKWASETRDNGIEPLFSNFYETLTHEQQQQINIYKK